MKQKICTHLFIIWIFVCSSLRFDIEAAEGCVQDMSKVEVGRKCRKECKTDKDCRSKGGNKGCHCDNVCGMSCFNIDADCEPPAAPEHGSVSGDNFIYGGVVEYSCDEAYVLVGSKFRTCHADRNWGGPEPTCELGCAPPQRYDVSFAEADGSGFAVGTVVKYACRFGYFIVGNNERTCQADYTWSEIDFVCTRVSCGDPGSPINGYIIGNEFTFGSAVIYHCEKGFVMDSELNRRRVCSTTGRWSGEPRTCSKLKCPPPEDPANGQALTADGTYEFRSLVTYECDFGYELNGNSQGECNEDGNWGPVPTCTVDVNCNFDGFDNPFCGYTNEGSGTWKRVFVQENTIFGNPTYVVRATSTPAIFRSPYISSNVPHCFRFHYVINGRLSSSDVLTIAETGGKVIGRIYKQEPRYRWLDQQMTVTSFAHGVQFEIISRDNRVGIDLDEFSLSKSPCKSHCDRNTCRNGGSCIDRKEGFTCICTRFFKGTNCEIEITCPKIGRVAHGSYKVSPDPDVLRVDTKVVFSCDENFRKTGGPASMICTDAGEWSEERRPICREIFCGPISKPSYSILTFEPRSALMRVGTVVRFACTRGRYLQGPSAIICTKTGSWSNRSPRFCREIQRIFTECPKGYRKVGLICYKVYDAEREEYEAATSKCASVGARVSAIQSREARETLSNFLSVGRDYHIGLSDIGRTEMTWSSGNQFVKVSSEYYSGDFSQKKKATVATRCGVIRKPSAARWRISTTSCFSQNRFVCERFASDVMPVRITLQNKVTNEKTISIYRPVAGLIYNKAVVYMHDRNGGNFYLYRRVTKDFTGWAVGEFLIADTLPVYDKIALEVKSSEILPQNIKGQWKFGSFYEKKGEDARAVITTYDRWGPWARWGACTVSCGGGKEHRQRFCDEKGGEEGFGDCPGYNLDARDCATKQCIPTRWSGWGPWSKCMKPCGGGTQKRDRICLKDPESLETCPGNNRSQRSCNTRKCEEATLEWVIAKPTEYNIFIGKGTKRDAERKCRKVGKGKGNLASIDSLKVLNLITDELRRVHCASESAYEEWKLWIDLFDNGTDTWKWGTGSTDLINTFAKEEKENRTGSCALLFHDCEKTLEWTSADCDDNIGTGFICQRAWHPCNRNPCENDGRCRRTKKGKKLYSCKCNPAYHGRNCSTPVTCNIQKLLKKYVVSDAVAMNEIKDGTIRKGQTIRLACKGKDMRGEGDEFLTCTDLDKWDKELGLTCEKVCYLPELHPSIVAKDRSEVLKTGVAVTVDTLVEFECPGNMQLKGNKTVLCTEEGWDEYFPTNCLNGRPCEGLPDKPTNGTLEIRPQQPGESYMVGTKIILRCEDQQNVQGLAIVSCNRDGGWDGDLGFCSENSGCVLKASKYDFGTFSHNFKTVENDSVFSTGMTVQLYCPSGSTFSLVEMVCKKSQLWEPSIEKALRKCE